MVGNKRLWSFRIAIGTHPHKEAAMAARLQAWGHETCRHEWYGTTTQSKRKVPWPKACYAWCLWFARVSLRATSLVVPSGSNLRIKHRLIWPGKGNQLAEPSGMRDFAPCQYGFFLGQTMPSHVHHALYFFHLLMILMCSKARVGFSNWHCQGRTSKSGARKQGGAEREAGQGPRGERSPDTRSIQAIHGDTFMATYRRYISLFVHLSIYLSVCPSLRLFRPSVPPICSVRLFRPSVVRRVRRIRSVRPVRRVLRVRRVFLFRVRRIRRIRRANLVCLVCLPVCLPVSLPVHFCDYVDFTVQTCIFGETPHKPWKHLQRTSQEKESCFPAVQAELIHSKDLSSFLRLLISSMNATVPSVWHR